MSIPMEMYLPIAGNSVNIAAVFGLGGGVGLLSGIFGVGGGFLMTPLLIMMGIPATVAAASDSNQIVGASTSGTLAHLRLGNVDIKMGILLLVGGVLGGTVGVGVIKALRQMGNADFLINVTYVLMLGLVGGYMFIESPIPDNTMSPTLPDADRHVFSVGLGRKSGGHSLDIAYAYSLFDDRKIDDNQDAAYNGDYDISSHLMGVSYGYTF